MSMDSTTKPGRHANARTVEALRRPDDQQSEPRSQEER